jgi:hypothetical protein
VRWFGDLSNPDFWIKDHLDQPDTWSANTLRALRDAHRQLVDKYHCGDAPSGPIDSESASAAHGSAASPLQLSPLNTLAEADSPDSEDDAAVSSAHLLSQNRVTTQVLTHWALHQQCLQQPPSPRCPLLRSFHAKQVIPAVTNTLDGDPDRSILKSNISEDASDRTLKWPPSAWLSYLSSKHGIMHFTGAEWQTWFLFCQYLGVPLPSMVALRRSRRLCSCSRTWYDEYGDHIDTCQKHSGNWHRANNHLLACLQSSFRTRASPLAPITFRASPPRATTPLSVT